MAVLAIDIGTTRTKAAVFDNDLTRSSLASRPTAGLRADGTVSTEPCVACAIETAVEACAQAGAGETITAVGVVSFLCHVLCDDSGASVADGMAWNWTEAAEEAQELSRLRPARAVAERPVTAELLAPRLLHLARVSPDIVARTHRVLALKDVLIRALGVEPAVDFSNRDYSLMIDRRGRPITWALSALRAAGAPDMSRGFLAAVPPHRIVGHIADSADRTPRPSPADRLRALLAPGTPVVTGSTDGTAAMYGAGVLAPNSVAAVFGTTDVMMQSVSALDDERTAELVAAGMSVNAAAVSGYDLIGGSTAAAGSAFDWCRNRFGDEAERWHTVPPGSDALRCAPSLGGERAPYGHPTARGAFVGVRLEHTGAHLTRALLEAQCFRVRRICEELGVDRPRDDKPGASVHADRSSSDQPRYGTARLYFGGGSTAPAEHRHIAGGGRRHNSSALTDLRAAILPLPMEQRTESELSLCGVAMFALTAHPDESARHQADRELTRLAGCAVDAGRSVGVPPRPLRETYDRLYQRWNDWMEEYMNRSGEQ